MWPQPYNWFTFVFCCFSASTFDLIKNTPMSFLSGKAASVKTMICYNQCYDVKMTSSFEWKWRAWSGAQCASVPINMKTSNDSNQPKRRKKFDPICSQYCVWYLSKGTKGELIVVDSTKGKHYRCPHKQRFFNRLSLLTQTSHTKISAIARCPNFFVPAIITELVKSTL